MNAPEATLRGAVAILMVALSEWRSGLSVDAPDVRTEIAIRVRTLFERGQFDCAPTPLLDAAAQLFATTGQPNDKAIAWARSYGKWALNRYLLEHEQTPGWIPSSVLALINND